MERNYMNRIDFMKQLESLLQNISPTEREEAIQYYNDYFNDAGVENEQNVIEALGTPAKVAETIRKDLNGNGYSESTFQREIPDDRAVVQYQKEEEMSNDTKDAVTINASSAENEASQGTNQEAGTSQNPFGNITNPFESIYGNNPNSFESIFGENGNTSESASSQQNSSNINVTNPFEGAYDSGMNQGSYQENGNTDSYQNPGMGSSYQNGTTGSAYANQENGYGQQNSGTNTGYQGSGTGSGYQNNNTGYGYQNTGYGSAYQNTGYSNYQNAGNGSAYANAGAIPMKQKKMSTGMTVLVVILCIFLAPVAFSVAGGIISIIFGLLAGWFGMIIGFGVATIALLVTGLCLAVFGVIGLFVSPFGGLGMIGGGLICGGIGLLFLMLTVAMAGIATPAIFRGIAWLWNSIFRKRKNYL